MPRPRRDVIRSEVRLSPEVHAQLAAAAEKDRRSVNAEIEVLIVEALDARGEKKPRAEKRAIKRPTRPADA